MTEPTKDVCAAGRTAFFEGRWEGVQCFLPPIHAIASEGFAGGTLLLCRQHFCEINDEGLVTEGYIGRQEFLKRGGRADL